MSTPPLNIPGLNGQQKGDTAPDSLLAHLRNVAAHKQEEKELTIGLPGIWEGNLRVTYRYLSLDEVEHYTSAPTAASTFSASLDMLGHACKRIEGYSPTEDKWYTLHDQDGYPLTFNDKLTRYLRLPRPDDDWEYSVRDTYEIMWEGNGFGVGLHLNRVAKWMGVTEEEIASGELTPAGLTSSVPPQSTVSAPNE